MSEKETHKIPGIANEKNTGVIPKSIPNFTRKRDVTSAQCSEFQRGKIQESARKLWEYL